MSDTDLPADASEQQARSDAHAKALALNLSNSVYGTFAEIGAGQEVARWFLRVGGASGTVARTISAYDKTFSDQIYGESGVRTRYVSRERLLAMLDHEFELLRKRLDATRGATTTFFAFADTAAARNFKGDNQQHAWVGIRFQITPRGETNDILLHVNLMDPTADRQQESLGVLGVNLIHAAFRERESCATLLAGIFEGLTLQQFEVDVVEVRGPALAGGLGGGLGLTSERCSLEALCRGMAHAVVFDAAGAVTEPSTVLRKKALIVERGRFEVVQPFQQGMLESARQQVLAENAALNVSSVMETTVLERDGTRRATPEEILERVRRIGPLGPVVVSDFPQSYLLVDYLRRHTTEPIFLVVGVSNLTQMFGHEHYQELPGSLLEGLGKLLARNVRLLAYPMPREEFLAALGPMAEILEPLPADKELIRAGDLRMKPPRQYLYDYVRAAGWISELEYAGGGRAAT